MALPKKDLQKLIETRDQLRAEMEALRHKIEGVEMAIGVLDEGSDGSAAGRSEPSERAPRGNVKSTLLKLLEDVGDKGLNAQSAVDLAAMRGIDLDRGTVSSLLSRFKRDGAVEHDGERYRLRPPGPPAPTSGVVDMKIQH